MDLKNLTSSIVEVAGEAARFISTEAVGYNPVNTEKKGFNDFVSYVDRGAEKIIVDRLSLLIPEAGFIVEENTSSKKGERYNWVADPLDGTTNFVHGIHPYAVSIALMDHDEVVAGVVYEAAGEEIFTAWNGGGAWLNGKKITVSAASAPGDCFVATGFPYKDFSRLPSYLDCLDFMLRKTRGVRRLGAASIDLAYVACGRFDIFFEYGLNPWDVAAGTLIVREAGGMVSDFSGNRKSLPAEEIIAGNSNAFPGMVEIISNFMLK